MFTCLFAAHANGQSGTVISLEKIQQRYAGKWPKNMSYIKKIVSRRYGRTDSSTHYYAYLFPLYTRIDDRSPNNGNSRILKGDSTWYFRYHRKDGNGQGHARRYFSDYMLGEIYWDDIEGLKKVLAYSKIDFTKQAKGIWEGRTVYVIGATTLEDRYHAQVWYDAEYLYPVRFFEGGTGNVLYSHYEIKRQGEVWQPVATKEFVNKRQTGEVRFVNFSFDRQLSEALFDPEKYGTFHWAQE
ncbi:hypothetical protein A8C56_14860 [Niabella ginsenosidivorans]|uniref:Outer membrane lipoprotein-sorting protein n=2 Tax=Niabella ginsenosidivorans TaxID=1176587 RepID=A0A1A9I5Z8_9BACT|nr:hypothetical protein A8C56_14860 [Niabella ginsenosidivorans]